MLTRFVLLNTPRVTQQRVEGHGMLIIDLHVMSLSSCELCTNCLTKCKGLNAIMSVVENDGGSVW